MNEELKKLHQQMISEVNNLQVNNELNNTFNNKSNKPYWNIEKKYKEKAKKIREKYKDTK